MPQLKRVLLFVAEVGVLFLGFSFSLGLAICLDSSKNNLAAIAFFSSLFLTVVGLLLFRRKTRKWKIEQDAASWMRNRPWRQLHPHQARHIRLVHRCLLWLPSVCAALVICFLPVASHLIFLGSHLVPHYRLSVPLNWTIIKSRGGYPLVWAFFSSEGAARYGLTPIWFNRSLPSGATFSISGPASAFAWNRPERELASGHMTHVAKTEFRMGMIAMNCWEYRHTYNDAAGPSSSLFTPAILWEVLCSTQPNGVDFNLHASFLGHKEDVPAFYKVLKEATSTP
jgi:hypothetical protein